MQFTFGLAKAAHLIHSAVITAMNAPIHSRCATASFEYSGSCHFWDKIGPPLTIKDPSTGHPIPHPPSYGEASSSLHLTDLLKPPNPLQQHYIMLLSSSLLFISLAIPHVAAAPWGNPFYQPIGVHVTSLQVTMKVPAVPTNLGDQTLFIWPGIQPGNGEVDGDPQGVNNGVLQPVLTFGLSCAPGVQPQNQWWISGQYVNTFTSNPNFAGCFGGPVLPLTAGELVTCTITVRAGTSTWDQLCTRSSDGEQVGFTFDLAGQQQNWAELVIEPASTQALQDWNFPVYFYAFSFTTDNAMPTSTCIVPQSGDNFLSYGSNLSADGKTCSLGAVGFWNTANGSPPITMIPPEDA